MKERFLEIIYGSYTIFIPLKNIHYICLRDKGIDIYITSEDAPYIVWSNNDGLARIKYNDLKAFMNYGPDTGDRIFQLKND